MANYICAARTNYFKVAEPRAFLDWLANFPTVEFSERDTDPEAKGMVGALFCEDMDGGSWPSYYWDEDDEEIEVDFIEEVASFLTPDSIAIFYEVGSEKMRYLAGYAVAINHKHETLSVGLSDIFQKIQDEWGIESPDSSGI